MPQVTLSGDVWVFGISNTDQCGGILHFRKYPDYDCPQHCFEDIPVLYTCEVVYVPPYENPEYTPDIVPVTYIPPGKYVVTSPSFSMHYNMRLWYFPDDGSGQRMSGNLQPDRLKYGGGSVTLFLQVTDERTKELIEVDTVTGEIVLPDETVKTVTTSMWNWNDEESQYECVWDLKNDSGEYSNGKEGVYTVSVAITKALYRNSTASTTFSVCFTDHIELVLDRDPPVYGEGAPVFLAVITDKDGFLSDELTLPDGSLAHLEWELSDNVYSAVYSPPMAGTYAITVWLENDDGICYLGKASSEFDVVGEGEFSCSLSEGEIDILARKYAPYMYFYEGFWGEEEYFPTYVELMLENSSLWEFRSDESIKIDEYDEAGTVEQKEEIISGLTSSGYYLDLNEKGCTIDSDLVDKQGRLNVYYRVVCYQYEGKMYIVIQYRFFYIFNDHIFDHEGEWEMVEILLDYHTRDPIGAAYSRHLDGEYRQWDDIEKEGTHPVVYIALGSHGAYFEEGIHQVQVYDDPHFELPFDITSDNGRRGFPSILSLIPDTSDLSWLRFAGNWGYCIQDKGKNNNEESCLWWNSGPYGPLYLRETWLDPVGWALSKESNRSETLCSPYTLFSLSCPADMLITNSAGQRLGFVNGGFVQEIPGSYVQDHDEEESYLITGINQYTVEIFGTGDGTFDLACSINLWDNAKVIRYSDVPVRTTTKAVLNLDSDLSLNVDTNQDGITDFTVFPISFQLSSPQPIKPLQTGSKMTYEVTLTNQGGMSTFVLDVDAPAAWSYSISCDTVILDPSESTTFLLTVTSSEEIPVQDYTIRVEATSLENSCMTATLELIASSKSELVAEDISVNCEDEVNITAFISNTGLSDAEAVKVQFFDSSQSKNSLLGEQTIIVPCGETVTTSVRCSLPDGFYTFCVVTDPDNLIPESCKSNNRLSVHYLLDRTPPEAEILFDPENEDFAVRGIDNLDSSVDVSVTEKVIKNKSTRMYTLTDDVGNTLELHLEINCSSHQIKAEIVDLKYNGESATLPKNSFKIEYVIKDGKVKMLSQFLTMGDTKVHLVYSGTKNQTKVVDGTEAIRGGLSLVVIRTNKGNLQYQIKRIR
jgi:hypothetical protein